MKGEHIMILVTGASGTVGSEVVRQLRQTGQPFRAAFHNAQKAAKAKAEGIDSVVLDFADRASIATALKGVDKLFLLGPTVANQAELENNVVDEAKKAGVKHIVKLSVFDAPEKKYIFAHWHLAVEENIERSGMTYTFLRPTGFMQNYVTYQGDTIRTQNSFYLAVADAETPFVDVRDIAAVAVKALTEPGHEGKAYNLTGPEPLNNYQVAEKLSRALGREIRYVAIPPEAFQQDAKAAGVPDFYIDALLDLDDFYINHDQPVSDSVQRVTGRKPRNFDDFARDYAHALAPAPARQAG
jgi:uncharacterized protein YbjT (DUF2867 family)